MGAGGVGGGDILGVKGLEGIRLVMFFRVGFGFSLDITGIL